MSYDGYIYGVGDHAVSDLGNMTSNHNRVWRRALEAAGFEGWLSDTDGMNVTDAARIFAAAAADMRANWDSYDAMHPIRDGVRIDWYDLEKATWYLENAAEQCRIFAPYRPDFRVRWSW